jgi:hypothetical protein
MGEFFSICIESLVVSAAASADLSKPSYKGEAIGFSSS